MTLGETIASVVVVCAVTSACTLGGGGGGATSGGSGTTPRDDGGVSGIGDAGADASSNAELGDATLTDVVFVPSEAGPRVLVRGTDPKKRIEWVRVRLLDDKGEPARFDIDGDGMLEPDVVDVPGSALDRGESGFFLEIQSAPHLDDFVKTVSVEIDDGRVPPLPPKTASLAPVPVRGPDEACDPQGFDRCSGAMVCAGTLGSARCAAPDAARAQRCATAPMILAGESGVVVGGRVSPGASLFEPTIGCTNGLRSDRPEAIFRLFVDRAYGELVLSTESPNTSLDTVVSVLESCGTSARVLACNDDDPPPYSTVVLTDVTPGTYIVVVDSLSRSGGAFELRVTAR